MIKKSKFTLSAIALLMTTNAFAVDGKLIEINYTDEDGVGFYSSEPYNIPGITAKTLGEARRNAFEYAVYVHSTRFYAKQPFIWSIGFNSEDSDLEDIINTLAFIEPEFNVEDEGPTHHFLNPKRAESDHLNERNIYPLTQYLAHTEAGTNNDSAIITVIPSEYRFDLYLNTDTSIHAFVNNTLTNALGFVTTNNIHNDAVEEAESIDKADEHDLNVQYHHSYLNKFLINSNKESLYGMDIEDVVTSVKDGVYFRHHDEDGKLQSYSPEMEKFLFENNIIDPDKDLGIPLHSNTNFNSVTEDETPDDTESECFEYGFDENDEPCNEEVIAKEDVIHENIEMLFSDSINVDHIPALTSQILCDLSWCSTSSTHENPDFKGKVIDLSVNLISESGSFNINANRSANLQFIVKSEDALSYPITSAVIEVAIPSEITIDKLNDKLLNSDTCTIDTIDVNSESEEVISYQLVKCDFETLTEDEDFWVRLTAPEGGNYSISSRVYSNASNVDINGLNNIRYQNIYFIPNDGKDAEGTEVDENDDDDKSGGSFGFLMVFLALPLAIFRKIKK